MNIRSYRARSVQEALALIRADLGPDAAVLHTREIAPGVPRWLGGTRMIEVYASNEADVPSRLPDVAADAQRYRARLAASAAGGVDLAEQDAAERRSSALDEVFSKLSPEKRERLARMLANE